MTDFIKESREAMRASWIEAMPWFFYVHRSFSALVLFTNLWLALAGEFSGMDARDNTTHLRNDGGDWPLGAFWCDSWSFGHARICSADPPSCRHVAVRVAVSHLDELPTCAGQPLSSVNAVPSGKLS